jgi:hypothetical protein
MAADGVGGNRRHVLAGRVAREEFEDQMDVIALDRDSHVHELSVTSRRPRSGAEGVE